jgi:hypothetical protein
MYSQKPCENSDVFTKLRKRINTTSADGTSLRFYSPMSLCWQSAPCWNTQMYSLKHIPIRPMAHRCNSTCFLKARGPASVVLPGMWNTCLQEVTKGLRWGEHVTRSRAIVA